MSDEGQTSKHTLRQLREARGLKLEDLAVQLKVPYGTLMNIESGRNGPRAELAEKLYLFFDVPVGTIEWPKRRARIRTSAGVHEHEASEDTSTE